VTNPHTQYPPEHLGPVIILLLTAILQQAMEDEASI
jgi:hypothetical protein